MKTDTRTEAERCLDTARAELLHSLLASKQLARANGVHLSAASDRAIRGAAYALEHTAARFADANRDVGIERKQEEAA